MHLGLFLSRLPMSHTWYVIISSFLFYQYNQSSFSFNQLILPPYPTRDILKEKLFLAIENCEGFGIE